MTPDDDTWLTALGRGADSQAGSPTEHEGALLRAAIRARVAEALAPVPAQDSGREAQLIARARAEGLLPAASPVAPPRRAPSANAWRAWLSGWRVGLAAAAIGCVALGIGLQMRSRTAPEAVRGAEDGIVRLSSADPVQLKLQIIAELRAAGVQANGYESFGRQGVDAELPIPVTAVVQRVLEHHGIPLPRSGILQLEIESARPP